MLDGFDVVAATSAGGTFNGSPWRIALHTTEGATAAGAIGAYRMTGSWPHFTVDCARHVKIQHYELSVSSRALLHPAGTPETNRANAINIELVGFATETPTWSKDSLLWLAANVLAPIRAVCPFALVAPPFVPYPQSYGTGASQRLTWQQWAGFSGVCGHQHVPGNDHGDPGLIDIATILGALGAAPAPTPTRRFKVNAVVSDPLSGETQIAELRDDGLVWLRNIKTGSTWYNLPALPGATAGKAVSLDAGYRKDGTLDVSVRTDKSVVWVIGAPAGKPFGGWYVPG